MRKKVSGIVLDSTKLILSPFYNCTKPRMAPGIRLRKSYWHLTTTLFSLNPRITPSTQNHKYCGLFWCLPCTTMSVCAFGGIREIPRGRRRGCGWYASKRIPPTGAVFQPGRPNADFTTMMPVERQGENVDFFSN